MNTEIQTPPALAWAPYNLTKIDQPRTGFVGRAAAMRINGVECIVMCRTNDDLAMVGATLTDNSFNPEMIYKATLINTTGIEVEAVAVVVEDEKPLDDTPADGGVSDATATAASVQLVRADGAPIVQYKSDNEWAQDLVEKTATPPVGDDDEL